VTDCAHELAAVVVARLARARIEGCGDTARLNRWIECAATATSVDKVFGPGDNAE
jgi:hypothetical protein